MSVHGTERRSNQRLRVAFEARWRSRVRDVCVELPSPAQAHRPEADQSRQGHTISKPYLIFFAPTPTGSIHDG
jgi:hypothetical protein